MYQVLWVLKGKSALMMFDKHANLKYKFGNRHFWAEGYYVSTVGLNEATIKKYIQEQRNYPVDDFFMSLNLESELNMIWHLIN